MGDSHVWREVIARARKCVVQIRSLSLRNFDSNPAASLMGTAFVIDKSLGLLLSNRHVVMTSPNRAYALFEGDEEVPVTSLYVDPIHDFGFFKINATDVKLKLCTEELTLDASGAKPGVEVRILGSDAGERTMVLKGTISRTDRNTPEYDKGSGFSDQNTFYITASCDTSSGSSGSPVLNIYGKVIALNAGASLDATSSFFLPLDCVVRVFKQIQTALVNNTPIPQCVKRGTILTVFLSQPMPECKRLGITDHEEASIRRETGNNGRSMLVVKDVLQQHRPTENLNNQETTCLKPGDVLLRINGQLMNDFNELEILLDDQFDQTVECELKRGSSTTIKVKTKVHDAYKLFIPHEFVEFSGGIIHSIGFSHARDFKIPLTSIFIEKAVFCFRQAGIIENFVILEVDSQSITDLNDFVEILKRKTDSSQMTMRVCHMFDRSLQSFEVIHCDRKWFDCNIVKRDELDFSKWHVSPIPLLSDNSDGSESDPNRRADDEPESPESEQARIPSNGQIVEKYFRALVIVEFHMPLPIDGHSYLEFMGTGFICDKTRGFIVTDRNTVASAVGEVTVNFLNGIERLEGKIMFLHPTINLVVIQYDVNRLSKATRSKLEEFQVDQSFTSNVKSGDVLHFVGLTRESKPISIPDKKVVAVERGTILTSFRARFAAKNFDYLKFEDGDISGSESLGGVFLKEMDNKEWVINGYLTSYSVGEEEDEVWIASCGPAFTSIMQQVQEKRDYMYSFACDFGPLPLSQARDGYQLSSGWAKRIAHLSEEIGRGEHEVFIVANVMADTPPSQVFHCGDILLAVNENVACSFSYQAVESECLKAKDGQVTVTVLRKGKVLENLPVQLFKMDGLGTRRLIRWGGLWLQETFEQMRWHGYIPVNPCGVYISFIETGSPAEDTSSTPISTASWLIEMNNHPIQSLDDILRVSSELNALNSNEKQQKSVRVRFREWQGGEFIETIDLNEQFWPTIELFYDKSTRDWIRRTH